MQQQQQLRSSSGHFYLRCQQLRVSVSASPEALTAEVESGGRLWAGEFSAAYLEELTRKTGSFKRYAVFVGMLVSAVGEQQKQRKKDQASESQEQLSLDLMTLDDLRALRAQRIGDDSNVATSTTARTPRGGGESIGKRYLILTYRTRFDQVHYPLALAHQGRVSPVVVGEKPPGRRRADDQEFDEDADDDCDVNNGGASSELAAENARLRAEVAQLQRRLAASEAESARRRREADELRNAERLLRLRLRQLTHELALLRRAPTSSAAKAAPTGARRSRPASAGNSPSPSPRVRDTYINYQQQQQQQQYARYQRRRSPSPRPPQAPLSARRHRDFASSARQQQQQRRRPRSNSCPRFDPTAYIADIERRRQESRERRRRDIADRIRLAGAPLPSPTPSVVSAASSTSYAARKVGVDDFSLDDEYDDIDADCLRRIGSFDLLASASASVPGRPRHSRSRQPRKSSTTRKSRTSAAEPKPVGGFGFDDDIQQIDERLDRLQSFLNKTLLIH